MSKFAAYGAQVQIGDGGGPEVFTTVAQVRDIGGLSLAADTIDVTTHDSVAGWREFVAGLIDGGELSLEIVYDPDSVTQSALRIDLVARVNARNFKLIFNDGSATTWEFAGIITAFEPSAGVEDELSASVTIKVNGAPTLT